MNFPGTCAPQISVSSSGRIATESFAMVSLELHKTAVTGSLLATYKPHESYRSALVAK